MIREGLVTLNYNHPINLSIRLNCKRISLECMCMFCIALEMGFSVVFSARAHTHRKSMNFNLNDCLTLTLTRSDRYNDGWMYRCVCVHFKFQTNISRDYILLVVPVPRTFVRLLKGNQSILVAFVLLFFSSSSLNRFVSFPFLISQTSSDKNRIKIGIRFSFPPFFWNSGVK